MWVATQPFMLVNVYINLLWEDHPEFWGWVSTKQDETKLLLCRSPNQRESIEILELYMETVGEWMRVNKLILNRNEVLLVQRNTIQMLDC